MRSIARQSARVIKQSRRSSCTRSNISGIPSRPFHTSCALPQDQRPHGDNPSEQHHTASQTKNEQEVAEADLVKSQQLKDGNDAGDAKATTDARRLGGRKRPRRTQDAPKPPPIPDWFLKHNVRLCTDIAIAGEKLKPLPFVDERTGHTLFTVQPYDTEADVSEGLGGPKAPAVRVPEKDETLIEQEIGSEIRQYEERNFTSVPALPSEVNGPASLVAHRQRFFDQQTPGGLAVPEKQQDGSPTETSNHDELSTQPKHRGDERIAKERDTSAGKVLIGSAATRDFSESDDRGYQLLTANRLTRGERLHSQAYAMLEAELAIRAGLTLLSKAHVLSSSYTATRVDVSLVCPDEQCHDFMDILVENLADNVQADVIRLDANDFEELTSEYVNQGDDAPGSFTNLAFDVFEGYIANTPTSMLAPAPPVEQDDTDDVREEDDEEEPPDEQSDRNGPNLADIRSLLWEKRHELSRALSQVNVNDLGTKSGLIVLDGMPGKGGRSTSSAKSSSSSKQSASDYFQWDDARLGALLDSLIDAPNRKRLGSDTTWKRRLSPKVETMSKLTHYPSMHEPWNAEARRYWYNSVAATIVNYVKDPLPTCRVHAQIKTPSSGALVASATATKRTIVHVRDLKDISRSKIGDAILRRLVRTVTKRRKAGEEVLIVGTTAAQETGFFGSAEPDDFPFRTITIPPKEGEFNLFEASTNYNGAKLTRQEPAYGRIFEINLRHISSMLRRLRPGEDLDFFHPRRKNLSTLEAQGLSQSVLPFDEIQRLVLMAIGLSESHAKSETITTAHITMAALISARVDRIMRQYTREQREIKEKTMLDLVKQKNMEAKAEGGKVARGKVDVIRKSCNAHETKLLTGVVDAQNIKTRFSDVHVQPETIEALKTLTSLSLIRPEAFQYGVLASDRLPGLLLYGPPGTGKTLLAKAVAKDSQATVMEVSGAQIYEKYVGEGEKMVRAVFTLAKKLSPCVVFIDEADAIFGSRGSSRGRNTHREIINQFLREWDGLNDAGCFMMVATNRPFDLDDAVLRRLPRRLLVDLPVATDRESILKIHLKNENVDSAVCLATLAEQTPLYSGSDLKNLCVAAALACVREENDILVKKSKEDADFRLPEKRTLMAHHFEKALTEISASINEDMSSLTEIRKFDEKYGERKGRRKKSGYGFGASDAKIDENSARVRQVSPSASPSSQPSVPLPGTDSVPPPAP